MMTLFFVQHKVKEMFRDKTSRILLLIGVLCFLTALFLLIDYSTPTKRISPDEKIFRIIVSDTDQEILAFGEMYLFYLDGEITDEEYLIEVKKFKENLEEINKDLDTFSPPEKFRNLYKKYKTGFFLIHSVLKSNIDRLTSENVDPDVSEKNQQKMHVGLTEIQEVKEVLLGDDKSI